ARTCSSRTRTGWRARRCARSRTRSYASGWAGGGVSSTSRSSPRRRQEPRSCESSSASPWLRRRRRAGRLRHRRHPVARPLGLDAIAATAHLDAAPFLAVLSHPPGVSRRVRLRYDPPQRALVARASERSFLAHADRRTAKLLRRFASVGVFSGDHAVWARRHGVRAWYAHYPMPDLAGPDWRELRAAAQAGAEKPRILMIGHLRGIGTISGLHLFVPGILPRLTEELGPDGFEVHVVGGQDPPPAFAEGLRHPAVSLRGQISSPEEEFFAAHVL